MRIYRYGRVDSTQNVAKELIRRGGAAEGRGGVPVVIADEQTNGRGRLDREWISPRSGLYFSAVLKKRDDMPLLAGVAVAKALKEFGIDAKIKWPNDIIVGEKKLAGILIEIFEGYSIVGVGVNMEAEPIPTATSVSEQGKSISKDELLERIMENFELRDTFNEYRKLSDTIGKRVRVNMVNGSVEGIASDIDEYGRLVLEFNGEIKKIASGDCIHLR